jgi:hypothetical protein
MEDLFCFLAGAGNSPLAYKAAGREGRTPCPPGAAAAEDTAVYFASVPDVSSDKLLYAVGQGLQPKAC